MLIITLTKKEARLIRELLDQVLVDRPEVSGQEPVYQFSKEEYSLLEDVVHKFYT